MGTPKALLDWDGAPLIRRQVDALIEAGLSPIIVVLGHAYEELAPVVPDAPVVHIVHNPDYKKGKTTSIKAGASELQRHGPGDSLLLLNVDQPRSANLIKRVVDAHDDSDAVVTVPTWGGKGGHPIVLSASLLGELLEIREETLGVKALRIRHESRTQRVDLGDPQVTLDMNTPDDYRKALDASHPV